MKPSTICKKCGGLKTKKAGRYLLCKPCTDARISAWKAPKRNELRSKNLAYKAGNRTKINDMEKCRRDRMRRMVLEHYGLLCSCCGENNQAFLCIDHIHGNGNKQRKDGISGTAMMKWLIDNNFPSGFRTLCHNCNFGIWAHGTCPHQGPPTKTGGPRYEYMKKLRAEIRRTVLLRYSPSMRCACCGEDCFEFLALDHVNGGGKAHQKSVGRGSMFYKWIVENNFPDGFQVLCHNCNFGKGTHQQCPHQHL